MNNNKLISLVVLLVSFMILVFFTRDFFYQMQANLDTQSQKSIEASTKKQELDTLNKLKAELDAWKDNSINRYIIDFKEDEIVGYIYGYLEQSNGESWVTLVKSITLNEGAVNEYGFKEASIQLDVRVSDEWAMTNFLSFLTSPKEKYNFFINNFTYPNNGIPGSYNVTIPLKVFYK